MIKGREEWATPAAYHRDRLHNTLYNARVNASVSNTPFDLDADYLLSIYPTNNRCPVLDIELEWGRKNGLNNSPSLDRVTPSRGYVKGNVAFISMRANRLKNDATPEELERVLIYIKGSITDECHPNGRTD